jgi:hypothetical protein
MMKMFRAAASTCGAMTLIIAPALDAQDSAARPHRLSTGGVSSREVMDASSGRSWRLSDANRTSKIDAAYLYDTQVAVFGWISATVGLTTIIDSASASESLEFLAFYPKMTSDGLIVFVRFYPHFSDPSIVDERIAELDLKRPFPHRVPTGEYENPTDEVGTAIYPSARAPNVRHYIGDHFLVASSGTLLFALDQLSTGEICLVRMRLPASSTGATTQRCVAPEVFGAHDFSSFNPSGDGRIESFSENASGNLTMTVETGGPHRLIQRTFEIDKNSLEAAELPITPQNPGAALAIPWQVAKASLTGFVAPDLGSKNLAPHLQDEIKVVLVIDVGGNVRQATISGVPADASVTLKSAIQKWKFKPTMLNGTMVEVTTQFASAVSGLSKVP